MINTCNVSVQFHGDVIYLFSLFPIEFAAFTQLFLNESTVEDKATVEISQESMCDWLWFMVIQVEITTITVARFTLQKQKYSNYYNN